ncbi:MAG: toll/interleukin-1 receptor domain-containing protein [Gammaproteobacteria bacterium]|nr:toll/interleukin-1 receptor domain-containing protein [Gammaproteobacteria bacterium]
MAKVFVSHKQSDEWIARRVSIRLRRNGFEVYLDSVDPALVRDGPELSDYLLHRMGECQQLIAVVSSATSYSWWVPWEIGVGSEKGFRMASFSQRSVALPTYLTKWPSLRSMDDVDLYCQYSTRTDRRISEATATVFSDSDRIGIQRSRAADFHRDLQAALARG